MKRSTLYLLLATLLIFSLIALGLRQQEREPQLSLVPMDGLSAERINRLDVTAGGDRKVAALISTDTGWQDEISGYRADAILAASTIAMLTSAQFVEAKTTQAEHYEKIGVESIYRERARGLEVTLSDSKQGLSQSILFGDFTNNGQYVRLNNEAQAWLIGTSIDLPIDNIEWLDRELLDISAEELVSIRIIHSDMSEIQLSRNPLTSSDFTMTGVNMDSTTKHNGNRIAGILSGLNMESVSTATAIKLPDTAAVRGEFHTRSGIIIYTHAWQSEEGILFTFDAGYAPTEDIIDSLAQTQAARIAAKLNGWVYTLPSFKTAQFLSRPADLLQ